MKRSIILIAAFGTLAVFAPVANADSSASSTTAVPATSVVTETPATTVTEVPATTVTEVPATTVTEVPTTTVVTETPTTTPSTPCITDCIPETVDACVDCIPSAGGGIPTSVGSGALPFTGIEDSIAPILLALTVLLGGVVAWRWAQLRESVARDATQAHTTPARHVHTGYAAALRTEMIERRARQVFTPRVA